MRLTGAASNPRDLGTLEDLSRLLERPALDWSWSDTIAAPCLWCGEMGSARLHRARSVLLARAILHCTSCWGVSAFGTCPEPISWRVAPSREAASISSPSDLCEATDTGG